MSKRKYTKNLQFKFEDFYDESHLNIEGSKKFAENLLAGMYGPIPPPPSQ